MGVVEKFLANLVDGESNFDFVGSDCGVSATVFAEKPGLDVAEVFCIVRCDDFNLFDDREVTQCLCSSRFLEIGSGFKLAERSRSQHNPIIWGLYLEQSLNL